MNNEQKQALLTVQDGHNLYLGGPAGTGKTYAVKEIVSWARNAGKKVALTCTTGVACCLYPQMFHAMTLHKWSGIGDGRLTVRQLTTLSTDDRYREAFQRVEQTDMLIIDEISMLSKTMFEKLEGLMRHLRGDDRVFGGAQVVVVGDFLQLPPVKNVRYEDLGEFCCISDSFPTHIVYLTEVLRQKDRCFSDAINDMAHGTMDDKLVAYMSQFRRPLMASDNETVRLFSSNLQTDIYNRDRLMKLPGDHVFEFEALDEGEERHLASLTVQKTIWLKTNAKVMLLRNLSDQLVNGLCGIVMKVLEGEVDVLFPTLDKMCKVTRMNFAVFDPSSNRNLAVRSQIPLKLCYAMTIHKAQGMTLNRVEVDCSQIFQAGQLAVAMGRVRSPDGLRLVNFSKDAIIPQPPVVLEFLHRESVPLKADMSCCHKRFDTEAIEVITTALPVRAMNCVQTDCDIDISASDFDEETDELMLEMDLDLEQLIFQPAEETPDVPLPPDFIVEEEIQALAFVDPVKEQQVVHNQWIQYLLDNIDQLEIFCSIHYSHIFKMYQKSIKDKQTQSAQTQFFSAFQMHTISSFYQASVLKLMPETEHVSVVFHLAFQIMSVLRSRLLQKMTESLPDAGFCKDVSKRQLSSDLTDTAKGKIRYIGGYVVAKLQYRTNLTIQRNAFKSGRDQIEQYELAKRTLKLIHCIKCSEASLQHSEYHDSLKETARKQNINRGLTNITDQAYKYFEHLINTVLSHLTGENLNTYDTELHTHIQESVTKDASLYEHFLHTIQNAFTTDDVSVDTDSTVESDECCVSACLHELAYNAEVTNELYSSIIYMVIAVLFKQFTSDIISSMNIKKKLEHRKQIHVSSTKKDKESKSKTKQTPKATALSKKKDKQSKSNTKSKQSPNATIFPLNIHGIQQEEPTPSTSRSEIQLEEPTPSASTSTHDIEGIICPKCNRLLSEGEDCICCDICDNWFDRKCAGLTNALQWKKHNKKNVKYYCHLCR